MAEGSVAENQVAGLRRSNWQSVFELIAARGIVISRGGVEITLLDDGLSVVRRGVPRTHIYWASLERWSGLDERYHGEAGPAFNLNSAREDGPDLFAELIAWCYEMRGEIAGADGSLVEALDAMAANGRLRFAFSQSGAVVTSFIAVVVGAMVVASFVQGPPLELTLLPILLFVALVLFAGWTAIASVSFWRDAGKEILVSNRGLSVSKDGRIFADLTWHEMTQPEALKLRNDKGVLGCSGDGRIAVDGRSMQRAPVLEIIVDHFITRELSRRGVTRTLKPKAVRSI
jgi:hypothetical protein